MLKQIIIQRGVTQRNTAVETPDGDLPEDPFYEIVRATVDSTGVTYCRLQYVSGDSYKWSGDHTEVDESTTEEDERWIKE